MAYVATACLWQGVCDKRTASAANVCLRQMCACGRMYSTNTGGPKRPWTLPLCWSCWCTSCLIWRKGTWCTSRCVNAAGGL